MDKNGSKTNAAAPDIKLFSACFVAGVGLWPFTISIVLYSLIIDKIGYKTAMIFALICHITSTILTTSATRFPVNKKVEAGPSYKEILQEVGAIGALIILSLIVFQLGETITPNLQSVNS